MKIPATASAMMFLALPSSVTVYKKIGVKSFKVEDRAGEEAVDNFLRSNAKAKEKSETKDSDQHN